jgi:hypothetical protein
MVTSRLSTEKLTPEEFILRAISALKTEKSKGIHTVYSGLNRAFSEYFGEKADVIQTTVNMRKEGKIAVFPTKGGVRLYLRRDLKPDTLITHDSEWEKRDIEGIRAVPKDSTQTSDSALNRILQS